MPSNISAGFGERLRSCIPKGATQKNFANLLDTSLASLGGWLSEKSEPKLETLALIAKQTGVDLNWLITGHRNHSSNKEDAFVSVKRIKVTGSAGGGAMNGDEKAGEPIAFRKDWLKAHVGVSADSLSVIQARGDSMEPTIRDGALILVNHSIERIENDGIYALAIDGDLYIKRIQKAFNGGLIIKSDNPAYEDQLIKKPETHDIKIVGLIKWAANTY